MRPQYVVVGQETVYPSVTTFLLAYELSIFLSLVFDDARPKMTHDNSSKTVIKS